MRTSVVKHSYIKVSKTGVKREAEEGTRLFFSSDSEKISNRQVQHAIGKQKERAGVLIHKLILSPGNNTTDKTEYTRQVMRELESHKGLDLQWFAVEHNNTRHHHAHVVILGVDRNQKTVRFDRHDYGTLRQIGNKALEIEQELITELDVSLWMRVSKARDSKDTLFDGLRRRTRQAEVAKPVGELEGAPGASNRPSFRGAWRVGWLNRFYERNVQFDTANRETDAIGERPTRAKPAADQKRIVTWQEPESDQSLSVTKKSSAKDLRALLKRCRQTGHHLDKEDYGTVMAWLTYQDRLDQSLTEKAKKIQNIEIDGETYTGQSPPDKLTQVLKDQKQGKIYLPEHELRAIASWLTVARSPKRQPPKKPGLNL